MLICLICEFSACRLAILPWFPNNLQALPGWLFSLSHGFTEIYVRPIIQRHLARASQLSHLLVLPQDKGTLLVGFNKTPFCLLATVFHLTEGSRNQAITMSSFAIVKTIPVLSLCG